MAQTTSITNIFSINTGHSGSLYLTKLFQHAQDCSSCHEIFPLMNAEEMIEWNKGNEKDLRDLMNEKLEKNEALREGKRVLVETNHMFIKGYGWIIPEHIKQENLGVVILKRDTKPTALSLLRNRSQPSSEFGELWTLVPGREKNVLPPPTDMSPLSQCAWYVEEVNARADKYKQQFPNIKYFETTIEQLNNYDHVVEMFAFFGLKPLDSLKETIGVKANTKSLMKLPADWEQWKPNPDHSNPDELNDEQRVEFVNTVGAWIAARVVDEFGPVPEGQTTNESYGTYPINCPCFNYSIEASNHFKSNIFLSSFEFDAGCNAFYRLVPNTPNGFKMLPGERYRCPRYMGDLKQL